MRLFLIPVSTRRTMLYAQRLGVTTSEGKAGLVDKLAARAATMWASFEKKESGWQKQLVVYGNQAFRRIPFEEWGLKSVPPLSMRRRQEELKDGGKVDLVFPSTVIAAQDAEALAKKLATERQTYHRQRMTWCLIAAPFTIPFALVPVIPNIPLFYLLYRAWSNWKAVAGGKHVQWLLENKLLTSSPSPKLDELYTNRPKTEKQGLEMPLFTHSKIKEFSETLDIPELETELDRAIWQVETAQKKEKEAKGIKESGTDKDKKDN